MKSASALINPTAYNNGYKFGRLGISGGNPYDIISSASKHKDFLDGFVDGETYRNNLPRAFGMRAVVVMKDKTKRTFRNVTEVHHNAPISRDITAFESDIHGTGSTILKADIFEFEVFPDYELSEVFEML